MHAVRIKPQAKRKARLPQEGVGVACVIAPLEIRVAPAVHQAQAVARFFAGDPCAEPALLRRRLQGVSVFHLRCEPLDPVAPAAEIPRCRAGVRLAGFVQKKVCRVLRPIPCRRFFIPFGDRMRGQAARFADGSVDMRKRIYVIQDLYFRVRRAGLTYGAGVRLGSISVR